MGYLVLVIFNKNIIFKYDIFYVKKKIYLLVSSRYYRFLNTNPLTEKLIYFICIDYDIFFLVSFLYNLTKLYLYIFKIYKK